MASCTYEPGWASCLGEDIPMYVLVTISVPKWFIRAVDKMRRGYIWKGWEKANAGNCFMAWSVQIRWMWFQKKDLERPWKGLNVSVHPNERDWMRHRENGQDRRARGRTVKQ